MVRLDKFLKISRIIKRRTLAKEVCDSGRAKVNERLAKPGTDVKPGDILDLDFGAKRIKVEILDTPENVRANQAKEIYKVLEEIRIIQ